MKNFYKIRFIFFTIVLFLVSVIFIILNYNYRFEKDNFIYYDNLRIATHALKFILPENYHDKIENEDSISLEEFNQIRNKLNKFVNEIQIDYIFSLIDLNDKLYLTSSNIKLSEVRNQSEYSFFKENPENYDFLKSKKDEKKIFYQTTKSNYNYTLNSFLSFKTNKGKNFFLSANLNSNQIEKSKQIALFYSILLGIIFFISSLFILYDFVFSKRILNSLRKSKKRKYYFYPLVLISFFLLTYNDYNEKKKELYKITNNQLLNSARTLKYILKEDFHDKVEELKKDDYKILIKKLNEITNDYELTYLYTIIEKDGKYFYPLSNYSEEDLKNGTITQFMEEFTNVNPEVNLGMKNNKIVFYEQTGTKWGDFRTIVLPIQSLNRRDYFIGADISLQKFNKLKNNIIKESVQNYIIYLFVSFAIFSFIIIYLPQIEIKNQYNRFKKFISLRTKLVIYVITIIFTLITVLSTIFIFNSKVLLNKKTLEVCHNFATNISNIAREDLITDSTYEATQTIINEIYHSGVEGLIDINIINVFGKYVIDLNRVKMNEFSSQQEIKYLQSIQEIDLEEAYSDIYGKDILKVTYPIFLNLDSEKIKIGAAVFVYDKSVLYLPIVKMQWIILLTGIFMLIVILILTITISKLITRPLVQLEDGVKIISGGDLNHRLDIQTNDEVGILSKSFNIMSANLKKSYEELEEKVIQRTSELTKTQATLTSVLENAPIILFATDIDGIVTTCEGKALIHIGIQRGQAVGLSFFDLFEDKPEALISARSALKGNNVIVLETLEKNTFEVNFNSLYDTKNNIVGMVSTYFDITENLKSQDAIRDERDKSDKLLLNILPIKIANELKQNGFVKPILYESVTVIFTDFKGFTKIATHMNPEELLSKLDMIFLQFDQICERRKIEKLKTIGDAYMCAGGLPEINKTHPIDACLAAIEIQHFMNETKEIMEMVSGEKFWDMRLGIHTGEVIAGVIGKTKFAYDVWGDAVNTASRMESNGEISKINISDSTYNSIKDFFDCEYRGKIEAKNKGMIDMYYLLRIKKEFSKDNEGIIPNELFFEKYKLIQ